jgi:flagellar protein FlaG
MIEARPVADEPSEVVKRQREKAKDMDQAVDQLAEAQEKNGVQAEELLQNIKALTENGLYSVRFELYEDTQDLVINLIEVETGELIRQIPSDEILGMNKFFRELRGNIIETKS